MPRRASSGVNKGQMVGIAVAIIGFFVIAALLIKLIAGDFIGGANSGSKRGGAGNATALSLRSYRENANSLRGNIYQIEGRIEEMLRWSDSARLISFEASDGTTSIPVPVLVPADFKNVNLERGSELSMVVRVNREGTLVAESIDQ